MEDERLQSGERRLPATAGWQPALPNPKTEKEMPDRASLAIRHLVGVSNQTKAELCVTVVSLSFEALSRSKVFTAYPFG